MNEVKIDGRTMIPSSTASTPVVVNSSASGGPQHKEQLLEYVEIQVKQLHDQLMDRLEHQQSIQHSSQQDLLTQAMALEAYLQSHLTQKKM